ncbi:MAG: phosphoenolpyruvate carboxykinase (ATP) [Bdellovibrionales bacterium]|nr:phosphoenolpyruvate carboxykinase (ATP) [Bdellovibrionales bacterium]
MQSNFDLSKHNIAVTTVFRNVAPAKLYEEALKNEKGSAISSTGALIVSSGEKTGRSPKDKRIVDHPESNKNIWWGDVNIKIDSEVFKINRERAVDYLNTCPQLFVVDGYAGWDPKYRLKVRVICSRAYHALFMHNMLIRPTPDQLAKFDEPDFVILNAGKFPANRYTRNMTSKTSIDLSFEDKELVILGTQYAGEMKKGVFSVMNYLMPKEDILSMHCSATLGTKGDTTLYFGLSGTGKTTLSADPKRKLIGDDEHCWSHDGIFNIEGGCYAKCISLSAEKEPEIYNSIRFGTVLENVIYDESDRKVNYESAELTENTRASYPIEYIPNAEIPCLGGHPQNIIFLTCDAFGVLPPVSRLTSTQAMYHFISGYTAKVAGTEMGVTEPQATFSACFGAAFMVWHPSKYAELLAKKIRDNNTKVWLINTGWTGGSYGVGQRFSLKYTRAIVDAINSNQLCDVATIEDKTFAFHVPTKCPGVPDNIMIPKNAWKDGAAYEKTSAHLAELFKKNFKKYADGASKEICAAGPK